MIPTLGVKRSVAGSDLSSLLKFYQFPRSTEPIWSKLTELLLAKKEESETKLEAPGDAKLDSATSIKRKPDDDKQKNKARSGVSELRRPVSHRGKYRGLLRVLSGN